MTISAKKNKTKKDEPFKTEVDNSEITEDEQQLQNALVRFETERRKQFEENLIAQKKSLEAQLRGQMTEYRFNNKNYQIQFVVISSRIKDRPIFGFSYEVDAKFNEFSYGQFLQEKLFDYFKSDEYQKAQKKLYYKLRTQGIEPAEIYPQIEIRWAMMDSKEKDNLRRMLRKDFTRKKTKHKGDKTG